MLGTVGFPQTLLAVIPAFVIAGLFGVLFISSAFYLRLYRVSKEHSLKQNMYKVRTVEDVNYVLGQLKGSEIISGAQGGENGKKQ